MPGNDCVEGDRAVPHRGGDWIRHVHTDAQDEPLQYIALPAPLTQNPASLRSRTSTSFGLLEPRDRIRASSVVRRPPAPARRGSTRVARAALDGCNTIGEPDTSHSGVPRAAIAATPAVCSSAMITLPAGAPVCASRCARSRVDGTTLRAGTAARPSAARACRREARRGSGPPQRIGDGERSHQPAIRGEGRERPRLSSATRKRIANTPLTRATRRLTA